MSKSHISKETITKGIVACVIGAASLGILTQTEYSLSAKNSAPAGAYTAGTYSAAVQGMLSEVAVTMTFDDSTITAVEIDASGETPEIGGACVETLCENILAAQSSEFDTVSGATVTGEAAKEAAASCIAQALGE